MRWKVEFVDDLVARFECPLKERPFRTDALAERCTRHSQGGTHLLNLLTRLKASTSQIGRPGGNQDFPRSSAISHEYLYEGFWIHGKRAVGQVVLREGFQALGHSRVASHER